MAISDEDRFHHRNNGDGSFDSICTDCFLTVAIGADEGQLANHEATHICSATRRFAVAMGASGALD